MGGIANYADVIATPGLQGARGAVKPAATHPSRSASFTEAVTMSPSRSLGCPRRSGCAINRIPRPMRL